MKICSVLLTIALFVCSSYTKQSASIDTASLSQFKPLVPVAVIGSGSAGFGASFVTSSKAFHTVVFQAGDLRGSLNYDKPVKNWLGAPQTPGKEIMARVEGQAVSMGAILTQDPIAKVNFTTYPYVLETKSNKKIYALSIVIATGSKPKPLLVTGAEQYLMKGVIEKVSKKDPTLQNKRVVIIGSGEDAISKAETLAPISQEVTILVKGNSFSAPAHKIERLQAIGGKVHILFSTQVKNIVGDEEKATGVEVVIDNVLHQICCDVVVSAIGQQGNSDLFRDYLDCNENGYIKVAPHTQATSLPGIFAAGDVAENSYGQAIISASDGMKAGYDVCAYFKTIDFNTEFQDSLAPNLYNP